MGFFKVVAKVLMPTLTILGFVSTLRFASENGFFDQISQKMETKSPRLGDTHYHLKMHWTGISLVDKLFVSIVTFFWPCIDGSTPNLTLQAVHFSGQLTATWILLLVESFRVGNYWKAVSFITLWGLAMENVAMAFAAPLYFSIHLVTSPTALSPNAASTAVRKTSLLVHPIELQVIPWAVMISLGTPLIMLALSIPNPEPLLWSQQLWLVVRNAHPVFTAILILVLSIFTRPAEAVFESAEQRNRNVLRALQNVHSFAIYVAAVPHIATVSMVLLSQLAPVVLARKYAALFDPKLLFSPTLFWADPQPKVFSIPHGATVFLQWDEAVSCAAVLLWAWANNREAISTDPTAPGFFSTLTKTIGMTLVGGPVAAAVYLISEKDQIILDRLESSEHEKRE